MTLYRINPAAAVLAAFIDGVVIVRIPKPVRG